MQEVSSKARLVEEGFLGRKVRNGERGYGEWKTEGGKEGREANQGVEAWLSSHTTSDFSGGSIDIETPDTQ